MLVDDKVMVENKAGIRLPMTAMEQALSYLSATDLELALVLHYGWKASFNRVICENRFKRHKRPGDKAG